MSVTIIQKTWKVDEVLTDCDSMTIGVTRSDTDAEVVAAGTAMTNVDTGTYEITITDPASGLTYDWTLVVTHDGHTHEFTGTELGGVDTSTTSSLTTLLPLVVPDVGGVPAALMTQAIIRAWRDFCRLSEGWEELLEITTVADQFDYAVPAVTDAVPIRVTDAYWTETKRSVDTGYTMTRNGNSISLARAPQNSDESITLVTIMLPSISATTAPTWMLEQYGEGIAAGAVAYLKSETERPWTDIKAFPLFDQRFRKMINQAKMDRFTERQSQPIGQILPTFC